MRLIGGGECYSKIKKAVYGFDAFRNKVVAPEGYAIIPEKERLKHGDIPFDVYSGWLNDKFNEKYHNQAISEGRWTTWARKI